MARSRRNMIMIFIVPFVRIVVIAIWTMATPVHLLWMPRNVWICAIGYTLCPEKSSISIGEFPSNYIIFLLRIRTIYSNEKVVTLDNNCKIHYEKLLLLCDTKYGPPADVQAKIPKGKTSDMPYNYAHINGRLDKIIIYYKIIELNNSKLARKRIIIYGYTLAIYECIDFLLKHGCQPEDITYVQPLKVEKPEYLNIPNTDKNLDNILIQMVADLGITIYESTNFRDFTFYKNVSFIKTANFQRFPQNELLFLECDLFINFQENHLTAPTEQSKFLKLFFNTTQFFSEVLSHW